MAAAPFLPGAGVLTRVSLPRTEQAAAEPKLSSRADLLDRAQAPLVQVPRPEWREPKAFKKRRPAVMRKNMNAAIDETLAEHPAAVYVGEDVEHGGYYLVTEGLAKKYPQRVRDFPPDETSLLAMGVGFAQAGLIPVVEIPYAKYLDCGFDMFNEIAIANWLSAGQKRNGMVIRLQGFDLGVFGGNFHTHNTLHIPPGVDVVCYSNGEDYVRGWRYAVEQAKAGRVVMTVDSTNLLNLRHVFDNDDSWRRPFPGAGEVLPFDEVRLHGNPEESSLAIVTYGNGVLTSLRAQRRLADEHGIAATIIDSPYLSSASTGLRDAVGGFDSVLFADVCKQGQQPLAGIITELQAGGDLPERWGAVAAQRTFNPLGSTLTFTSVDDVVEAALATVGARSTGGGANAPISADDLGGLTVPELRAEAKRCGLPGTSRMNKQALLDAIAAARDR